MFRGCTEGPSLEHHPAVPHATPASSLFPELLVRERTLLAREPQAKSKDPPLSRTRSRHPSPAALHYARLVQCEGKTCLQAASIAAAACPEGRSPCAIQREANRKIKDMGRYEGLRKLLWSQEQVLLAMCVSFSRKNYPLSPQQIILVVRIAFNLEVSKMWVSRFLKRHTDRLTSTTSQGSSSSKNCDGSICKSWVEEPISYVSELAELNSKKEFDENNIVSYYPMRMTIEGKAVTLQSLEKVEEREMEEVEEAEQEEIDGEEQEEEEGMEGEERRTFGRPTMNWSCTMIPFISASGQVISFHFVSEASPGMDMSQSQSKIKDSSSSVFVYTTESGSWHDIFSNHVMNDFRKEWKKEHDRLPCYIIGTSVERQMVFDLIIEGTPHGFHHLFFPASSSHWSHPLHNLVYNKRKDNILLQNLVAPDVSGSIDASALVEMCNQFINLWRRPDVASAYEECGVLPFDANIIRNAQERGTPNPLVSICQEESSRNRLTSKETKVQEEERTHWGGIPSIVEDEGSLEVRRSGRKSTQVNEDLGMRIMPAREVEREKWDEVKERREKDEEKEKEKEEDKESDTVGNSHKGKKRKRARKETQAAEKRKKNDGSEEDAICQIGCGKKRRKQDKNWWKCAHCPRYWICARCYCKVSGGRAMGAHERVCQQNGTREEMATRGNDQVDVQAADGRGRGRKSREKGKEERAAARTGVQRGAKYSTEV